MTNITDVPRTAVHLALAALACLAMTAIFASSADAYSSSFCGSTYPNGQNCYAAGETQHTWNYIDVTSTSSSKDICGYISTYADGNSPIYGSGCHPGTEYSFCHAPVVNLYYAFGTHFNDSGSIELAGFAETGVSCSAAVPAAISPLAAVPPPANMAVFARPASASDQAPTAVGALAAADNAGASPAGIDAADARRVGSSAGVYVLPAAAGLCAALQIPSGDATSLACNDRGHEDVVSSVTYTPQGYTVWGAAADGVGSVAITLASGQAATIPVVNNGFSATFASKPSFAGSASA